MKAVTRPLGRDVDLNGFARGDGFLFVRDGVGLAGRGEAARVRFAEAPAALAAIERDDDVGQPGCGPVAIGVRPFRPGCRSELVIPAVVIGKGRRRRALAHHRRRRRGRPGTAAGRRPRPQDRFAVCPACPSRPTWLPSSPDARRCGPGGSPRWCIARDVLVEADRPLDVHAILLRLRATFGSSYRYSIGGFVGASPELLVARHGDVVRSHPLAGTAPRTGDPVGGRPSGGGAHRVDQGPGGAPGRHRRRPRDAPALVQLPGLGGRAIDRRPWPTCSTSAP